MPILDYDIKTYIEAVKFGHEAHKEQLYGQHPYTRHLAHVENVLTRFAFTDLDYLAAAWLHDSIEDETGVSAEKIIERLGSPTIARLVVSVSDGKGANRRERKQSSYEKMRAYPESISLKLADRIANVESCIHDGNDWLLSTYCKEHAGFREQLFHVSQTVGSTNTRIRAMWAYLDELLKDEPASAGRGDTKDS